MVVEKRKYNRMDLEDISAKLYKASDGLEIDFCPINVSKKGISIFVSSALSVGEKVTLGLDVGDVPLIVRWCRAKEDDPAVFRVGLETENPGDQLDEMIKKELEID